AQLLLGGWLRRPANHVGERKYACIAPEALGGLADVDDLLPGLVRVHRDGKQKIRVSRGELPAFLGTGRVHDRRRTIVGSRKSVYAFEVVELSFPVEGTLV